MSAALERRLDPIEEAASLPTVVSISYNGVINGSSMEYAWTLLCRKHPVLRASISTEDTGKMLRVDSDHIPEYIVCDGDEGWIQDEAMKGWDASSGLSRLALVRGQYGGTISLIIDHAIVDGVAVIAYLKELWDVYGKVHSGQKVVMSPGDSLPRPPTELFYERWRDVDLRSTEDSEEACYFDAPSPLDVRKIRLTKSQTKELREAAHTCGVSVHSILCGAILVAMRCQSDIADSAKMVCDSNVDLRNRVSPKVGATETTNFFTQHKAIVLVSRDDTPEAVGSAVKSELEDAIACRTLPIYKAPAYRYVHVDTRLPQRLAFIHVSNIGSIDIFPRLSDAAITDMPVMFPKESSATYSGYAAYSVEGCLRLYCGYPSVLFPPDQVDLIVDEIEQNLLGIALRLN